ncbi:MAG: histone deacetylase [Actinomycetota bacterium]
MSLLVVTHDRYVDHDTGGWHPERPARLGAVLDGLGQGGLDDAIVRVDPEPAPLDVIGRVHDDALISHVAALSRRGGGAIDADTIVSEASYEAALLAAGAGPTAVAALDRGEADAAFCAVRPPGHHATPFTAMGFCLFNNVAVTAQLLADRGERVLIVDFDAHHGNGTQDAFYADPNVFFVSLHEHPLYPGTGRHDEVGDGEGYGTTLNVPLPSGATGDVELRAVDELVLPAVEPFAPTWLLISAGFDGHRADPLTGLRLTSGDFADIIGRLLPLVPAGRRLLFLEGGYDLSALRDSVASSLARVLDLEHRPEAASSGGPGREVIERVLRYRHEVGLS